MRFSLVIPCFNEEKNIPLLIERCKFIGQHDEIELVLVDNGSIDNTANVSSHPLKIRTSAGGSDFTTGVTENYNSTTGLTQFIVPHEPSDTSLVYQCTNHGSMVGNITIV